MSPWIHYRMDVKQTWLYTNECNVISKWMKYRLPSFRLPVFAHFLDALITRATKSRHVELTGIRKYKQTRKSSCVNARGIQRPPRSKCSLCLLCLLTRGEGLPPSSPGWGRGYPHPVLGGGYPHPVLNWGYPIQSQWRGISWGTPILILDGVPPSWPGMGVLLSWPGTGHPHQEGWGTPHQKG